MTIQFYSVKNFLLAILIIAGSLSAGSSKAQPVLSLTPVITSALDQPIQFVNAGDGSNRVFIVQKGGGIRVYDASFNFLSTFLTVTGITSNGERGLLSMAFHPDYASNGFFFVYYTNANGDLEIARYHVSSDPTMADASSKQVVLTIPHPTNSNHNGGELHFGADGFLYLSTGDGGGSGDQPNNAQNNNVLLGKLLRLNVNTFATAPFYTVPAGNPFNNEIFDLGLRNPFRWSFDRTTNDIWIGDVGQNSFEEINFKPAADAPGANFGWRCYEANTAYNTAGCLAASNYVFPVYNYPTQNPSAAVTGGIVYRGTAFPSLQGYYVAADFYSGTFYLVARNGSNFTTTTQVIPTTGIADFGETENGEAYVVSLTGGAVYRLESSSGGPLPVTLRAFSGAVNGGAVKLDWNTSTEINLKQFDIEYSLNSSSFSPAGTVAANNATNGAAYTFTHVLNNSGPVFYRLKMTDLDGSFSYSNVIKVMVADGNTKLIAPTVIKDGYLRVNLANRNYSSLELINSNGVRVFNRSLEGQTGRLEMATGTLVPGIYIVRLTGNGDPVSERVVVQ